MTCSWNADDADRADNRGFWWWSSEKIHCIRLPLFLKYLNLWWI